jgi:hypothetical protein
MLKLAALPLAVLALALCAQAATPIARVSSSQSFDINGAAITVGGVPSWLLFAGDVIVTHSDRATVIFRGGGRIILEPDSELKIEVKNKKPLVSLLHGSGKYFLGGAVAALSVKTALYLDSRNSTGNFAPQATPKVPVASPSQ